MATNAETGRAPRQQRGFMADQQFFVRYALVLVLFILFGFLQFSLRGFVDIRTMPLLVHLHAAVMLAWLGLFILQNLLVHRGELALHRKLGWLALGVAGAIALLGWAVGYQAVAAGRVPPFFTAPYFLALTFLESTFFAAIVAWAVSQRRRTEWHRRLMFGATFVILEPALGRLLPMPVLGAWGEWVVLAVQLLFVAVLARHDRKMFGSVHPATVAVGGILIASHLVITGVATLPATESLARAVAAG